MELPSPKVIMIVAGMVFIGLTVTDEGPADAGLDFELDDDLVLDGRADSAPLQRAPAVTGKQRVDGGGGDAPVPTLAVAVPAQVLAGGPPCGIHKTHVRLERHTEPDHGDVCRDGGGFWACPAGCTKNPLNRAPYCTRPAGGPRAGGAICRAPAPLPTAPRPKGGFEPDGVTLLISFFSAPASKRHDEFIGAILANILNPALSELVVLYEGKCAELEARLLERIKELAPGGVRCKLTCQQAGSQPTYADMFRYSSVQPDGPLVGGVVIVANVDVVFDDSLAQLPRLTGLSAYALSINSKTNLVHYLQATGFATMCHGKKAVRDGRCPFGNQQSGYGPRTMSWDGFAFRALALPADFAERANAAGSALDTVMNLIGAENRAKCGLEAAGVSVYNACIWVRMQHYHHCGGLSHNNTEITKPNEACDRNTYPCMMMYSGTIPDGKTVAVPVVDTSMCRGDYNVPRPSSDPEKWPPRR